jgi:hypothetical protein
MFIVHSQAWATGHLATHLYSVRAGSPSQAQAQARSFAFYGFVAAVS